MTRAPALRRGVLAVAAAAGLAGCAAAAPQGPAEGFTAGASQQAWLEACEGSRDWDGPGPPFRIHGDSYWVGTCGIAAILVAGEEGHVLIDSGTVAGGQVVARNIEALGYALEDVEILLHTQEHFDHVAGIGELQRRTGARLLASAKATEVFETGETHPDDPQAGLHEPFPTARVDGLVTEGQAVRLGDRTLVPIATPGHSAGALSWQWSECADGRCLTLLYSDGLGPISADDYRFSEHPAYLDAFRASIHKVRDARCDIFLTPHPAASAIPERIENGTRLIDPRECARFAGDIEAMLERRLAREAESAN